MEGSAQELINSLAQGQQPSNALFNLGVDNFGWAPAFADYKQILEQLKTGDEMLIYEGMVNLASQLSMAQENTLSAFPLDQYVPVLVEVLRRPPATDLSNEVNMFVVQCLTNLMDIFPTVCGTIVNHGAVKAVVEVLERSMGFIDLNDACIKCMEKISLENPYAILTSGALGLCLNMMDFFEIPTQKKILQLTLNVSRHSASETDFNDFILPTLPCLCGLLHARDDHAAAKIEIVLHIAQKICESVLRFYSPATHFQKVAEQFEKLGDLVDCVLQKLQDFCATSEEPMDVDQASLNLIQQQSAPKSLSTLSVQYALRILTSCAKFSARLTKAMVDYDVLRLLTAFLPSKEDLQKSRVSQEKFPFVGEAVQLIDAVLPEREELLRSDQEKQRLAQERDKHAMFAHQALFMAEKLLPKVFFVYENNISHPIRSKTLQIIDKMISLFSDELLNNFIEPYSFAKFIYSNLRTLQLASVKLSLQMVTKLMRSNAKNYTLALMREGVTEFVKKVAVQEALEKTLGLKLSQPPEEKHEEFLAKSRLAFLQRAVEGSSDKESTEQFESTIQRYLEASKLHQAQPKVDVEAAKAVLALAAPLCADYFENQEFQEKLTEWYGEEFRLITMLRNLATDVVEEAKQEAFNFDRTKALMKQLADCLTNKRQVMTFEFKESGLLEALALFLTRTPTQVLALKQKQGEEVKHSEEVQMSQALKGAQTVGKKEARCFVQRLKVFAHVVLSKANDKKPVQELINLCQELLSQSESEIFSLQNTVDPNQGSVFGNIYGGSEDPNQSVTALRQLTKRVRINLVYDPSKNFVKQSPKTQSESLQLQTVQKASSHHPAFLVLGDQLQVEHSKVFAKRNFLYSELQQVLISVEQCASLWLLEDFLRNKIRTVEDVKALKQPQSFYQSLKKGDKVLDTQARQMLDRALDRMREIMESGNNRERIREEGDEFAEQFSQEIVDNKDLNELEQLEIIKQLERQTLQMMDEFYADQDNALYQEMMRDELQEDEDEINTEQRMYEMQRTIEMLRQLFRGKKQDQRQRERADADMVVAKEPGKNLEELLQQIKQKEEPVNQAEEEKKEGAKKEDVDMTDEEEEEQRRMIEMLEKKKAQAKAQREVELSVQDNQQVKDMDLDELIKATGGDIEFEFYYNGQLVSHNQTVFEIVRAAESKQKDPLGYRAADSLGNFYFLIKDRGDDLNLQRKDSILEFTVRRERTKSEAVEDISVSAANSLVGQLIEKEFQVFNKKETKSDKADPSSELVQLENALKILKVLNFICKNYHILSSQGLKLIINGYNEEEQKEEMYSDLALQIGVSELHQNAFHHHKLDAFILKNIQDPYTLIGGGISDTLQQIFRNCPFLFPFQTRQLFFKLISFIGAIDMNRSIYFLRQFLKHKLGKIPQEDKNTAVKFQKQKVIVDRSSILDSAHRLMKQINKRAFLEIQFKDEEGIGLGPTLEFYYLVAHELKNTEVSFGSQRAPIWRKNMTDNSLFPAPVSVPALRTDDLQHVYEVFRLAGMMVAKSISDDRLIDLPISSLMWDLLLGKKMNVFDLEKIDKDLFKIFSEFQLIANRKRELDKQIYLDPESKARQVNALRTTQGARIEDLALAFTMPGFDHIELKQNGKSIDLNLHNLQEYIDLVMHFTFHESIKIQLQAFRKGFNLIFPLETLKPFSTANELEEMICGVQRNDEDWQNIARLKESVVPAHGYYQDSKEYLEFLRFMSELDYEERRKFLKFVTGSPRLPNGGFAVLEPKLTLVHKKALPGENSDDILPSVMTCHNFVKMPSYSSYEKLKAKFEMAYNEGTNNFTLS